MGVGLLFVYVVRSAGTGGGGGCICSIWCMPDCADWRQQVLWGLACAGVHQRNAILTAKGDDTIMLHKA